MMEDYSQRLRESVLDCKELKTPQQKADGLNLIEAILTGDMNDQDIVDAVLNDTLPEVYFVKEQEP